MELPKTFRESFDRVAFARRMKEYRMARMWTLEQMATAAGVDLRTIWNLENARSTPQELTYRRITRAIPELADEPQEATA